ncbi:MAG: hypothetical protein HRU11_03080 [Parvularculaceae bacterium]|nr:hypothetical protein [Parvularculaceae bacterium]
MASTTWNMPDIVPSAAPTAAPVLETEDSASPATLEKVLIRRRGQRPLQFYGVHLLRISGPEVGEHHPRHMADLYQTVDGGYAVSLLQERDDNIQEIAAFAGRDLSGLVDQCEAVDPMASVPCVAWQRLGANQDLSPSMKAALMTAFNEETYENFHQTVQRLRGRSQAEQA